MRALVRNVCDVVSDSQLALAAASGDRRALADIYDRYANTLYDLCRAVLGDGHAPSDALRDTFVIAATRLGALSDPTRLKPWLCAIARHESLRRSSRPERTRRARDEVLGVPVTDAIAGTLVTDDAEHLAWQPAESLTDAERAVLVLNARQGLEGAELAAAAGFSLSTTSTLLTRAKTQLVSTLRCSWLVRGERERCAELASIAPRKHAALDASSRKRVMRHAASCASCGPKWNASPDAFVMLAAAPLLGAPVALRHEVLNDPLLISSSRPLGGGEWQRDGFPPRSEQPGGRSRVVAWLGAAALVLSVAGGLVLTSDDDTRSLAGPGSATTTTDPAEVEAFEPWPTSPPNEPTTTTKKGATTTTTKRVTTTTRAAATTTTVVQTTVPTPFSISAGMREATLRCNESGHVTATTTGQPEGLLIVQWRDSSGSGGGTNMQKTGASTWSGAAGPMSHTGTWTWWVQEFPNGARSATHTVDVVSAGENPC